jgi:hypothetical protein
MNQLKCQQIVPSRSRRGEPSMCGREGRSCRLTGLLASVPTILCAKHLKVFASEGYSIEPPVAETASVRKNEVGGADDPLLPFERPDHPQGALNPRPSPLEEPEARPVSGTDEDANDEPEIGSEENLTPETAVTRSNDGYH